MAEEEESPVETDLERMLENAASQKPRKHLSKNKMLNDEKGKKWFLVTLITSTLSGEDTSQFILHPGEKMS